MKTTELNEEEKVELTQVLENQEKKERRSAWGILGYIFLCTLLLISVFLMNHSPKRIFIREETEIRGMEFTYSAPLKVNVEYVTKKEFIENIKSLNDTNRIAVVSFPDTLQSLFMIPIFPEYGH